MKTLTPEQLQARTQAEDLILSGVAPTDPAVIALERIFDPKYFIQFEGSRYFIPVARLELGDEYANEDECEAGSVIYKVYRIEYSEECNGNVGYCTFAYSFEDTEIEESIPFGTED